MLSPVLFDKVVEARSRRSGDLRFCVLGPLRAWVLDEEVAIGPRKQQIVLAALLCTPNKYVSLDVLVEAVWGERPPRSARKNLHVYICNLRARLRQAGAGECIVNRDHGYVAPLAPNELDSLMFEELSRAAAHLAPAGGGDAAAALRQALDLWRGPAFEGFEHIPLIAAEAELLARRHLTVFEMWAEAAVASGPAAVIDEIEAVIRTDPFRERLRMIHMTALQREGRSSEALAVFDDYRQALAREFGLAPSAAMERLHARLLLDTPASPEPANRPRAYPLPRLAAMFSGRADEVSLVTTALRERGEKLVVICGPVGTGKTTLATRCAQELGAAFADGQFFVSLRAVDGGPKPVDLVLRELLRDTGMFCSAEPTRALQATWQSWLSTHEALVVLDDAVDESMVDLLLPLAGTSAVMVTSRARLSGLAQAVRICLTELSPADALDLLARHIGVDRIEADRSAAESIVLATGLLPLGIAIIGSKLAGLRHLPLREYAARLAESPSLVDELCVGRFAVRPRLESVVRDLPSAAQQWFVRLGRLPEPRFKLDHAEALLPADHRAARLALEHLIEANVLVVPDSEVSAHEVIYQLPDLLFQYAGELAGLGRPGLGRAGSAVNRSGHRGSRR